MNKSSVKTIAANLGATTHSETAKPSPVGEGFKADDKKARLEQCEQIIHQSEEGIFSAGRNLAIINAQNLYKAGGYSSFEKYCKDRWGYSYQHAYRLMNAAKCYDFLAKFEKEEGWVLPKIEAQIRELAALPENDWERTWRKFLKKMAGKKFTAEDVEAFISGGEKKKTAVKTKTSDSDTDSVANEGGEVPAKMLQKKLDEVDELIDEALELTEDEEVRALLERIKTLIESNN
jgi:hypothetical protein